LEGKPIEVINETIGKAKAFYFSRSSGEQLSWDDYSRYRKQRTEIPEKHRVEGLPSTDAPVEQEAPLFKPSEHQSDANTTATAGLHGAAPPLSFSNIAELIASGKTHLIPNNDIIPDKLSEEKPSESRAPARKKPWETNALATTESPVDASTP